MKDVLIIGGGAIGASIALFCKQRDASLSVTVVDPDLLGDLAASATAGSGGSRRLFFCPENIAMSDYSIRYFQALDAQAASPLERVDWCARGYLFIVPPKGVAMLESNLAVQLRMGVDAQWLTPAQIAERFALLRVDDLGAGVYSPQDGWFDARKYWRLMVDKARRAGVEFVDDAVVGFEQSQGLVRSALLRSGARVAADFFVNAAGPWAQQICAMVGMPLPVNPMLRYEHLFTAQEGGRPHMPYVKDVQGLAIRSSASGYSGGLVDTKVPRGFAQVLDEGWFDRIVRPAVQWRFPGLGPLQLLKSWCGLYEQCELDGNPIIGPWSQRANFIVAAGFSGHGLMHAPATGLAVAEWIVDGRYETLDLQRFGHARVENHQPYREQGII